MNREDILGLARLSRIELSEHEIESFTKEIDAVLSYVSVVDEITAHTGDTKKPGALRNVFRDDVVTVVKDAHTTDLLRAAPQTKGRHIAVKKILNQDQTI